MQRILRIYVCRNNRDNKKPQNADKRLNSYNNIFMKFIGKQEKEITLRRVLFLRYGTEKPKIDSKPIISLGIVANLIHMPYEKIKWMVRQYFDNLKRVNNRESIQPPKFNPSKLHKTERVTLATIRNSERDYLMNPDNMYKQAHLSLTQRAKLFHRQFPNRIIKPKDYSRILKFNGCKFKKVKTVNMPQKKDKLYKKYADQTIELREKVNEIIRQNYHLIFADEAVFKARGFQKHAWSGPNQNILVEDRTGKQPCQAVCAAVCKCHGVLTYQIEDYSFDQEKFESFLKEVRAASGSDEKLYLFLDNSGVHRCCKDKMEELNIEPVWNVPYRFEFNAACERYWAQLKQSWRPLLLSKMLEEHSNKDMLLAETVKETILTTSHDSIPKYIDSGIRQLNEFADEYIEMINWNQEK